MKQTKNLRSKVVEKILYISPDLSKSKGTSLRSKYFLLQLLKGQKKVLLFAKGYEKVGLEGQLPIPEGRGLNREVQRKN